MSLKEELEALLALTRRVERKKAEGALFQEVAESTLQKAKEAFVSKHQNPMWSVFYTAPSFEHETFGQPARFLMVFDNEAEAQERCRQYNEPGSRTSTHNKRWDASCSYLRNGWFYQLLDKPKNVEEAQIDTSKTPLLDTPEI